MQHAQTEKAEKSLFRQIIFTFNCSHQWHMPCKTSYMSSTWKKQQQARHSVQCCPPRTQSPLSLRLFTNLTNDDITTDQAMAAIDIELISFTTCSDHGKS